MAKERIVSNPKILGGKPTIIGTRISVEFILELLSSNWSYKQIIADYNIKKEDIVAAINFAREIVTDLQTIPLKSIQVAK